MYHPYFSETWWLKIQSSIELIINKMCFWLFFIINIIFACNIEFILIIPQTLDTETVWGAEQISAIKQTQGVKWLCQEDNLINWWTWDLTSYHILLYPKLFSPIPYISLHTQWVGVNKWSAQHNYLKGTKHTFSCLWNAAQHSSTMLKQGECSKYSYHHPHKKSTHTHREQILEGWINHTQSLNLRSEIMAILFSHFIHLLKFPYSLQYTHVICQNKGLLLTPQYTQLCSWTEEWVSE